MQCLYPSYSLESDKMYVFKCNEHGRSMVTDYLLLNMSNSKLGTFPFDEFNFSEAQ